ncbi:MAG: DUF3343 domain-containing protein [Deltaproteobacteria bacterium]|nr:DUF3343 domain-containing protein [Deltaproteobacteria bacterium]
MRILRFENVHKVMEAEKRLKNAGVKAELAPLPRDLSEECGVCLEIADPDEARARDALLDLDFAVIERP